MRWLLVFCRARLQPCHEVCSINAALAAGMFEIELPHGPHGEYSVHARSSIDSREFKTDRLKPVLLQCGKVAKGGAIPGGNGVLVTFMSMPSRV